MFQQRDKVLYEEHPRVYGEKPLRIMQGVVK